MLEIKYLSNLSQSLIPHMRSNETHVSLIFRDVWIIINFQVIFYPHITNLEAKLYTHKVLYLIKPIIPRGNQI